MARYVSRPQEVEAVQWTGDNPEAIEKVVGPDKASTTIFGDGQLYLYAGQDGVQDWILVPQGHWLVHRPGDTSDIWPIHPARFKATYTRVSKK